MKEALKKYCGIFPAFYACYEDNGDVSIERTKALVRHCIKKGLKGIYVCGSSGECIYLNKEERMRTLEAIMEEARGKLVVIAHVAANSTRESVELARHAEKLGVDAIASIPPIYFKLPEHAIAQYWNDISAAAPNTDYIIYNIPQLAGTALTTSLLREMLKNPRVVGVKNSSMPTQDIQMWKAEGGEDFIVFNGPDEQLVSGLAIGACGGIGGTYLAMPEAYLKIKELMDKGEVPAARKLQYLCDDAIYALCGCKGNMYAAIKEVLRRREGIDIGGVRAPLANLFPEDEAQICACVEKIDRLMDEVAKY